MLRSIGQLVRALARLALWAGILAAVAALSTAVVRRFAEPPAHGSGGGGGGGRGSEEGSAGNGSLGRHRGVPMSFDTWPPVPQAPGRSGT